MPVELFILCHNSMMPIELVMVRLFWSHIIIPHYHTMIKGYGYNDIKKKKMYIYIYICNQNLLGYVHSINRFLLILCIV